MRLWLWVNSANGGLMQSTTDLAVARRWAFGGAIVLEVLAERFDA